MLKKYFFAVLERIFTYFIRNYNFKVIEANYYENELYELKYSFLKGTLEKLTCIMRCEAKKKLVDCSLASYI